MQFTPCKPYLTTVVAALLLSVSTAQAQDIYVDNVDAGFTLLSGSWNTGAYGTPYGSDYNWTETTAFSGGGTAEAEWRPNLPVAGSYTVFVYYVPGTNRADNAPYTVHHTGGDTTININQQNNGETWVSLGNYSFNAGAGGSVSLSNEAHTAVIIADVVRFSYNGPTIELSMDVTPAAAGSTSPAVGGPYAYIENQVINIDATPAPGYVFDAWLTSAGAAPTNPTAPQTSITMDQSKTITASFVSAPPVDLVMLVSPPGAGGVSPAIGGPYSYAINSSVALAAEPMPGYRFDHWEVSTGASVDDPAASDTTILMETAKTVTAVFVEGSEETSFRGFWADAFHSGYKTQAEIDTMVAQAVAGNYNAILPEVLAYQDITGSGHGAYWDSSIIPAANDTSSSSFDPLAYLVQQAHAAGIEVHCWLVAFRVCNSWPPSGNSIMAAHPEWLMVPRSNIGGGPTTVDGHYVLDPGSPDVQNYMASIVHELCTNYEIDGIHWDYIRYTTTDAGYPTDTNYENSSLARFQRVTGRSDIPSTSDSQWNDFRRRTISEFVRRMLWEMATAENPRQPLRHSAALITWGNAPSNFSSTSAYGIFQNWRYWLEQGYLDTGIPMTYYNDNTYYSWYRNWVDASIGWRYNRQLVTGPGVYLNTAANSLSQMQYALDAGADGLCTYSYGAPGTDIGASWYNYIATNLFTKPVDTPPMTWRNPMTAVDGTIYGRVADGETGEPIDDAEILINGFSSGIYSDGNGYFILTQLPAVAAGSSYELAARYSGYSDAVRSAVRVDPAGFTLANLGLGNWLPGDENVDGMVDATDFSTWTPSMTGPDNGPIPAGGDLFDFDQDDDVDLHDFQGLQTAAGTSTL